MSLKKMLSKTIHIIVPIILGTSIELYSFSKIAIFIFSLSVIQIIISLFIKPESLKNNKDLSKKYSIKKFLKYVKKNNIKKIKIYQLSSIAYGIIESSISTLIIIITIMTFKTTINLGILTTLFAICSIFALYLYNKLYNSNNSKFFLILTSIFMIIGVIGLLIDINKITLIIYNFAYAVSMCIFDVIYNTKKGNLVEECNISKYRIEFIGYSSFFITLGRIMGYTFMLVASFNNNIMIFKSLLIVVTLFVPIYGILVNKLEKTKI